MRESAGSPDGMSIDTKKGDVCISLGLIPGRKQIIGSRYIHPEPPRVVGFFSPLHEPQDIGHVGRLRTIGSAAFAAANNLSARSHNAPTTTANPVGSEELLLSRGNGWGNKRRVRRGQLFLGDRVSLFSFISVRATRGT